MPKSHRILLHVADGERRPVHPDEVFYLEAEGDATTVRLRSNRLLTDPRSLGELETLFAPHGFLRIHRNHMVNLERIRTIRVVGTGLCARGWGRSGMGTIGK